MSSSDDFLTWSDLDLDDTVLEEVEEIKDLGVHYDTLLLFDKHVSEKVKKAYSMLGIIKRNFA